MKTDRLLICALLSLTAILAVGCGSKGSDLNSMSKAEQEKAFKGDPNKIPADIKAKYMTPVATAAPKVDPATAAGQTKPPQ